MVEVVGFQNFFQLAKSTVKISPPPKIAQAKHIRVEVPDCFDNVVQLDGEVFPIKGPGEIELKFKSQIKFLKYNP
jgi:hypothetical protein